MREVAIVLGRCERERQLFGMRFVSESAGLWVARWAFDVLEQEAKRERRDESSIEGTFRFGPEYPGCPYCAAHSVTKCSCGQITCWDGAQKSVPCAWCASRGRVGGVVRSLAAGGDA